jgi:hypothetical protein
VEPAAWSTWCEAWGITAGRIVEALDVAAA